MIHQAKRLPTLELEPADTGRVRRQWQVFGFVNAGQWGGIFFTGWLLPRLGLVLYFISVMAALVGLHLFPLARLFRYAHHYLTGSTLLL